MYRMLFSRNFLQFKTSFGVNILLWYYIQMNNLFIRLMSITRVVARVIAGQEWHVTSM